jgi:hypothetical protein
VVLFSGSASFLFPTFTFGHEMHSVLNPVAPHSSCLLDPQVSS